MERIALIGFGEAARAFVAGGLAAGAAFDIDAQKRDAIGAHDSVAAALDGASLVLSLVTADQALAAAEACAASLAPGALYCDMNSVAPATKSAAAAMIEAAGARYADVAVMAPVLPDQLDVPLLVSGPHETAAVLAAVGFTSVRSVGTDIGRASTIKMLRSVMVKGMEALTAECLLACHRAGVTDEVMASFGGDWANGADHRLDRMLVHGLRRSSELVEAGRTLHALGISPTLTDGTVARQRAIGELALSPIPAGLHAKLTSIVARLA